MLEHLSQGMTAIDIGAHRGVYTYWMQKAVGPTGRVLAFEPQPELAAYLQDATTTFDWSQVSVFDVALSCSRDRRMLFRPKTKPSIAATLERVYKNPDAEAVPVNLETLDDALRQGGRRPVHFLKCNVGGHEFDVFRGAERILREDRPALLFEHNGRNRPIGEIDTVFEYLQDLGYHGYFFDRGRKRPVREFSIAEHQNYEAYPPRSSRFCNKFSFVSRI